MTSAQTAAGIDVGLLYLIPSVAATVTTFVAAVYLFDRSRRARTLRPFAVVLLAEALWSAATVAELSAHTLERKVFWDALQLPMVFVTGVGLFEFGLRYTGREPSDLWKMRIGLSLLPALVSLWVLTDPLHGQARADATLIPNTHFDALVYSFTLPEVAAFTYCVALVLTAASLLVLELIRQSTAYRLQTWVVLIGTLAPLSPAVLLFADIHLFGQRDTSAIVFCAAAIVVVWGLSSRGLFELVPVARDVVFARIPDAILVVDGEDRVVDANRAALDLMGKRTVPGRLPIAEAFEGVTLDVTGSAVREVQLQHEGQTRSFSQRVAGLRDEQASRVGRVVVLSDITRRVVAEREVQAAHDGLEARVEARTRDLAHANNALKREIDDRRAAELALSESEQRFRAVFDQTFQLLGILGLDGTVLLVNQTALSFVGVGAEALEGQLFWETRFWSHSPALQERLRLAVRAAARGELVRFEATHPAADGVEHVIDFSIKPIVGVDGVPGLLVAEGRDVTANKRAAVERQELELQLHQMQKMESLGRLAGGVAHDFNNLLTAIMGNASLIERRAKDTPLAKLARNILQAAESSAELTRQLLTFSRRQVIDRKVRSLDELLRRVVSLLDRIVGEGVELVLDIKHPGLHARIDAGQVEQAIVNLAVNARDAMPDGGKLTLEVDRVELDQDELSRLGLGQGAGAFVVLRVRDTGVGMLPEVRVRMFEPFFTTKDASRGTGLGLSMVFGAMRQNDGAVTLASSSPEGTTFELYLPLVDERVAELEEAGPRATGGSESIIVVEDQRFILDLTTHWLADLGYRVRGFESAEEAISSLRDADGVDLLLTDVVLGGISGRFLAERLRDKNPALRVLFMSGYHEDLSIDGVDGAARVQVLPKPFTVGQLAHVVREVLDAEQQPEPA